MADQIMFYSSYIKFYSNIQVQHVSKIKHSTARASGLGRDRQGCLIESCAPMGHGEPRGPRARDQGQRSFTHARQQLLKEKAPLAAVYTNSSSLH